jgi:hypothetical protein
LLAGPEQPIGIGVMPRAGMVFRAYHLTMLAALLLVLAVDAPSSPNADVVATIQGRNILRKDAPNGGALAPLVLRELIFQLASKEGIVASAKEVDTVLARAKDRRAEPITMEERKFIGTLIVGFKVDQLLWRRYGGRVIATMFGPSAVGAEQRYLEDEQKKGTFTILDASFAKDFWDAIASKDEETVDEDDVKQMMTTAWYLEGEKQ